jgi:SOS-response transcriptional repressor LexA
MTKRGKITLKAENKKFDDIEVSDSDSLYIIGKVLIK